MNKEEYSPQEKQNKLIEKCKSLAEKIENEKSNIKRMFYSIKMDMLLSKVQREIDIRKLQEKYKGDREDKVQEKNKDRASTRTEIIEKTEEIKKLKKFLEENKQYDYDSESFMFDKEDVENEGGINPYIGVLNNSGVTIQEKTAKKMQEVYEAREKLEELQNQVEEKNGELRDSGKKYKKEEFKSKVTETAMIAVKKGNIFQRIGAFFKSFKENFKQVREEYKDIKSIKNQKSKDEKVLNDEYWTKLENIEKQYEEKHQKLLKEYEDLRDAYEKDKENAEYRYKNNSEKKDEIYGKKVDQKASERRYEQANAFKEKIANMENYSGHTGTNSNQTQVLEQTIDESEKGQEIVD